MLSGAPPVEKLNGIDDVTPGFRNLPAGDTAGKELWSNDDAQGFINQTFLGSE
jgi:hypothetical protein